MRTDVIRMVYVSGEKIQRLSQCLELYITIAPQLLKGRVNQPELQANRRMTFEQA